MNPIDNIMALADEYADAGIYEPAARLRQALRAAIEQALGQGEPVIGTKAWFDPATGAVITQNLYPSDVYTAPEPQPKQEPFATMTVTKNMGAQFKFNRSHILLPGQVFYVYTTPQPQPKQEPLTDEKIQDLLKKGNPTAEEMRLIRLGYAAQPYDQQALELCEKCGWKTLIPGEGCLNCERQPQRDDTAGKMIAAGNRMAAMLDTSLTAPIEEWPDEAEIDAAIKEWRFVADGVSGAGMDPRNHLRDATKMVKREWVGLTDEDIDALPLSAVTKRYAYADARAIEAKLKEKNT